MKLKKLKIKYNEKIKKPIHKQWKQWEKENS